jgi:HsdM N-terminal domain
VVLKKSDLYRSLWRSRDELRGDMDASQYKDYSLTLVFVRYFTRMTQFMPKWGRYRELNEGPLGHQELVAGSEARP